MDELWFSEMQTKNVRFNVKVKNQLHHEKSDYQTISVFDSEEFRRFLTLDGIISLTEKDEFIYHEMITHPAMAVNPDIRNVLVIGAGDGGVVRELCRYKSILRIDAVEIDRRVTEVCREYLPETAGSFEDERVSLYIEDGLRFIRKKENVYDLIIVDTTDFSGPGEVLFTREFYGSCSRALTQNGIFLTQQESPFYTEDEDELKETYQRLARSFPVSRIYQAYNPIGTAGHWLFSFASKKFDPLTDADTEKWDRLGIKTRYYNTALQREAFCLPNYLKELFSL